MRFIFVILLLTISTPLSVHAATGYDIMHSVNQQSNIHKTQEANIHMVITKEDGSQRERNFISLRKNTSELNKTFLKFYTPANIKNTALITHSSNTTLDVDQWIYLPAFKSVKKLQSSDRNKSFMGSDFSYNDISPRQLDNDTHILTKETDKYYFIQSTPKDNTDHYSKIEYTINKEIYIPVQVIFYNIDGDKLKTLTNKKVQHLDNMYIVTESIMQNHLTNSNTTLDLSDIELGIEISDHDVGIKQLQ